MKDLKQKQRTAMEAVARRFSATWDKGDDPADAHLTIAGEQVAVQITTLKGQGIGEGDAATPHLRFDKVATKLVERLQAFVRETAPAGVIVLVTITAPIRLPAKTAASLEDKIRTLLRQAPGRDEKDTIHGNRVQIRLVRDGSGRAPKMLGFVHNSDSDPVPVLNMTLELLELMSAENGRRTSRPAGDRWLVLMSG